MDARAQRWKARASELRLKADQGRSSWHLAMKQNEQLRHQYMDGIDAMAESKQNAQLLVPSTQDEAFDVI